MVLPHVIKYNKKAAEKELAELSIACGLGKAIEPKDVLNYTWFDRDRCLLNSL
jgi:alcohol dehydrogenase class IV